MTKAEIMAAPPASGPDGPDHLRMVEAMLFASAEPLSLEEIAARLPEGVDVAAHVATLVESYKNRGIELVRAGGRYYFRTAPDLAFLLRREVEEPRSLSRAAVETLAIIAYHQPVSRAEIEEIRGVGLSRGTLDILLELGWIRPCGRRRTPGRPLTYGTSEDFLVHFGLDSLDDLPGLADLKAAGLLDSVEEALARHAEEAADEGAREGGANGGETALQTDLEDMLRGPGPADEGPADA